MKSPRNIVYDILAANGLVIERENISPESVRILIDYGQNMWVDGYRDKEQD